MDFILQKNMAAVYYEMDFILQKNMAAVYMTKGQN